jgi:hypothetical protein
LISPRPTASAPRRRGRTLAAAVTAGVVAVTAGATALGGPERIWEKLHGEGATESLHEFAHEHGSLNRRSQSLAYIMEKMEGGGEVAFGPQQEAYTNRAFPRTTVAQPQTSGSRAAYVASVTRGKSSKHKPATGTWTLLDNSTGTVPGEVTYTGQSSHVSGRVTALALDPNGRTVYVGSSGGGIWKTADITVAKPVWTSVGNDLPTGAIGSLTLAGETLYAGTGEANGSSDSEAGAGLFASTDGGATWKEVTGFHQDSVDRSISSIAVDPSNPAHLLVGTAVGRHGASGVNGGRYTPPGAAPIGLYESTDTGGTWTQVINEAQDEVVGSSATGGDLFRGGVTKVEYDPSDPTTTYAAVSDYGLYRRMKGQSGFTRVYGVHNAGSVALSGSSRIEFDATVKDGHTRIYLGDATRFNDNAAGLMRTDDATAAAVAWTSLSSATKGTRGYDSYNFCQGQCSYDMAVTVPPGRPDSVLLSGSMNYDEIFTAHQPSNGRAVVRSTDAGVSFTDMTNDAAGNGLHPDQHALAFFPGKPDAWVLGDDGGVAVESGPFVDASASCGTRGLGATELASCKRWLSAVPTSNREVNQGLQTLEYGSVSVKDGIVQGGTQDNGTWQSDYPGGWAETVGGDGGQSAFNAGNSNVRYHTYYNPQQDVNFRGSDPKGWNWISDPLLASGEASSFYMPVEADQTAPGTLYNGLQHIFRTTDNGGSQASLEKHCNELTGDFSTACGDFVPLGTAGANQAGDLSGSAYGTDNAGAANYVTAIAHSQRKTGVLWSATRRGRLFITQNANAKDASSVTFTRLDQKVTGDALPVRFVSGIQVDPTNANHAVVSYSGYSAYSAGGHVYDVTFNPATGTANARDISGDLGDMPVLDVALDWRTGAVYAATDWGVLVKPAGTSTYLATPGLPKVAVYGLTLDESGKRLYAATHGRGAYVNRIS